MEELMAAAAVVAL
jgi:hypothetical protein